MVSENHMQVGTRAALVGNPVYPKYRWQGTSRRVWNSSLVSQGDAQLRKAEQQQKLRWATVPVTKTVPNKTTYFPPGGYQKDILVD